MKFERYTDYKHKNCLDAFIRVSTVTIDTGEKAIVWASWMIQGTEAHWFGSNIERIFIKPDEYENWMPYEPKGDTRYE